MFHMQSEGISHVQVFTIDFTCTFIYIATEERV